jgi:hypothetical protein
MPDGERRLAPTGGPRIPFMNVDVGAADAGASHPDKDFVVSDRGHRHVMQLESGACVGLHECSHEHCSMA